MLWSEKLSQVFATFLAYINYFKKAFFSSRIRMLQSVPECKFVFLIVTVLKVTCNALDSC